MEYNASEVFDWLTEAARDANRLRKALISMGFRQETAEEMSKEVFTQLVAAAFGSTQQTTGV